MQEEKMSIHKLVLLCNHLTLKSPNKGPEIDDVLCTLGYDSDLGENSKLEELRVMCEELGELGWVINPFWEANLNLDETIPKTWYLKKEDGSIDGISQYFTIDNYSLLKNSIAYARFGVPHKFYSWINEAEKLFFEKRYTPCVLMQTAILEGCIRECKIDLWKQKLTSFYNEAVGDKIRIIYNDDYTKLINKFYESHVILPSLNGFIEAYFNGKRPFDKKIEPTYLERNWLMHGMTTRKITEIDCIKLFNTLSSLAFLTEVL